MLNMEKSITLTGNSMIGEEIAEGYRAEIKSHNPEDMNISSWQQNKALYKANRVQCREDAAAFEEAAYALQDEMIAELANKTESTEA